MRHNITLTKENSALFRQLQAALGLKPSAVIAQALHLLKKAELGGKEAVQ